MRDQSSGTISARFWMLEVKSMQYILACPWRLTKTLNINNASKIRAPEHVVIMKHQGLKFQQKNQNLPTSSLCKSTN